MLILESVSKKFFDGLFSKRVCFSLEEISFSLRPGKVVSFCGPNGSGKTTTLKLIVGLLKRDSGDIFLDNRPLSSLNSRKKISYLPELIELYPSLSPREFLRTSACLLGVKGVEDSVEKALKKACLPERFRSQRIGTLSKGSRKKVLWAELLLKEARYYILDEPFTDFDRETREAFRQWVLAEAALGSGFLLCSHNPQGFFPEADEELFIEEGRLQ